MITDIVTLSDLDTLREQTNLTGHIFRGQSEYLWELTPTIQRPGNQAILANELQVYVRFRQALQARSLPIRPTQPQAAGQWLALMQHYEIPTRLLDWTHDLLVGLHFACYSSPACDGALYVLNPLPVFQGAFPRMTAIPSMFVGPETAPYFNFPEDRYTWFRSSPLQTLVAPISPLAPNEREQIQRGIFTVSTDLSHSQDEMLHGLGSTPDDFVKIRIHQGIKNDIIQMLETQHDITNNYLMSPIAELAARIKRMYP